MLSYKPYNRITLIANMYHDQISCRPIYLFIAYAFSIFSLTTLRAQDKFPITFPRTPEASALIDLVDIPVGHYTGTATVNIPIWSYSENSLQGDVSVNYRTGGVKLNDIASTVGLGWELEVGPMITRKVNGLPDELESQNYDYDIKGFLEVRKSYTHQDIVSFQFNNAELYHSDNSLYDKFAYGCYDAEPDEFYFRIGEFSGKFMYDWSPGSDPIVICDSEVKVTKIHEHAFTWKVTTPDGNVYLFDSEGIEWTNSSSDISTIGCSSVTSRLTGIPSSWRCTSAHDVNNVTSIAYTYNSYNYQKNWLGDAVRTRSISGNTGHDACPGNATGQISGSSFSIKIHGLLPGSVEFSSGEYINFVYKEVERQDKAGLLSTSGFVSLEYAEIGFRNDVKYKYHLIQDYSSGRLTLKEIKKEGRNGKYMPPYKFTYYAGSLPDISSRSIDMFGYFNNKGNQTLIPEQIVPLNATATSYHKIAGADRSSELASTKVGNLKSVTTPSDAVTTFDYELNRYSYIMGREVANLEEYNVETPTYSASSVNYNQPEENVVIESQPFELLEETVVTFIKTGKAPRPCFSKTTQTYIENISDGSVYGLTLIQDENVNKSEYINLPAGNYKIVAKAVYCDYGATVNNEQSVKGMVSYDVLTKSIVKQKNCGGLRIKTKTVDPGSGQPPINYTYQYEDVDDGYSSGVIYAEPQFTYEQDAHLWKDYGGIGGATYEGICRVEESFGRPAFQLAQTKGSHIGYSRVMESTSDNFENGYTEYLFSSALDYPDRINFASPFGSPQSFNYMTGNLMKTTHFSKNLNKVQTTEYQYDYFHTEIDRAKVGFNSLIQLNENDHNYATFTNSTGSGDIYSRWFVSYTDGFSKVKSTIVTNFFENGSVVFKTDNSYSIDGYYLQSITSNEGTESFSKKIYKYPKDLGLSCLINRHMLEIPVEEYTVDEDGVTIAGSKEHYAQVVSGQPQEVLTCNMNFPIIVNKNSYWNTDIEDWVPNFEILKVGDDLLPLQIKQRKIGLIEVITYDDRKIASHAIVNDGIKTQEKAWEYDENTELLKKFTDFDGIDEEYEYDDFNRISKIYEYSRKVRTELRYGNKLSDSYNYVHTTTHYEKVEGSNIDQLSTIQYYDGLGREIQTVRKNYGQNYEDIVSVKKYNNLGKVHSEYVPIPNISSSEYYVLDPSRLPNWTYTYSSDPLARVVELTDPINGLSTLYSYDSNGESVTTPNNNLYPVASLFCIITETSDNSNFKQSQYIDRLNNLILSENVIDVSRGEVAGTYYSYDKLNRIQFVFPPKNLFESKYTFFENKYDGAGNLIYQKVPEKLAKHITYDDRDLPIFVQDSGMPNGYDYVAIRYDEFGRPIQTGLQSGDMPTVMADDIPITHQLTATEYGEKGIQAGKVVRGTTRILDRNTLNDGDQHTSYENQYDLFGRISSRISDHHYKILETDSAKLEINYEYDFADNIVKQSYDLVVKDRSYQHIAESTIDHSGRVQDRFLTIGQNGQLSVKTQTSHSTYSPHDNILQLSLGATSVGTWLQQIDYNYDHHGRLLDINQVDHFNSDLFALHIDYGEKGIDASNSILSITTRTGTDRHFTRSFDYDGLNRLLSVGYQDHNNQAAVDRYKSTYEYDLRGNITKLDRWGAFYDSQSNLSYNQIDKLSYSYQQNSNDIKKIIDGVDSSPEAAAAGYASRGDAEYIYDPRTKNVIFDPSRNVDISYNYLDLPYLFLIREDKSIEITYDANGIKLCEKEIGTNNEAVTRRDYLGPFILLNGQVQQIIHADGQVVPGNECQGYIHVDGVISYVGGAGAATITADATVSSGATLYLDASKSITLQPGFKVEPGGKLFAEVGPCTWKPSSEWKWHYTIRDHLGNARITFVDDNGDGEINPATDVLLENHYYAFGLEMQGEWNDPPNQSTTEQRYRYNAIERNDELGLDLAPFRSYDPAIGRWLQIDPLTVVVPSMTPYRFGFNNPIQYSDPLGLLEEESKASRARARSKKRSARRRARNSARAARRSARIQRQRDRIIARRNQTTHSWSDFRKADLRLYSQQNGTCFPCDENDLGSSFERLFFATSWRNEPGMSAIMKLRYNVDTWKNGGIRNTRPDFVGDRSILVGLFPIRYKQVREGNAFEVKQKNGGVYLSTSVNQIKGHIQNLAARHSGVKQLGFHPMFQLVTTSDVKYSTSIAAFARSLGVKYQHRYAQFRIRNGSWQFRFNYRTP